MLGSIVLPIRRCAALLAAVLSACGEPEPSGPPPAGLGERCELGVMPCVEGALCDVVNYPPLCDDVGVCIAMPASCEAPPDPRCGCDEQLYESACAAAMAGTAVGDAYLCTAPAGTFACGDQFCERETQYCEYRVGGGQTTEWGCFALDCPAGKTGCACIADPTPCSEVNTYFHQLCFTTDDGDPLLECLRP